MKWIGEMGRNQWGGLEGVEVLAWTSDIPSTPAGSPNDLVNGAQYLIRDKGPHWEMCSSHPSDDWKNAPRTISKEVGWDTIALEWMQEDSYCLIIPASV